MKYEDYLRLRTLRLKVRAVYASLLFAIVFLVTSLNVSGLAEVLRQLTDLALLRVLSFVGLVISLFIVFKGERINEGFSLFAEEKRLTTEYGTTFKTIEKFLRGDFEVG
jgi:cytochrome c biogenesis protein CcdA